MSVPINCRSGGILMAKNAPPLEAERSRRIRFDILPDDVLLDIFDFYVDISLENTRVIEKWQTLIHVCRQWRSLVFRSPRRLNLRLLCTPKTRTRDPGTLDVWPALPIVVYGEMAGSPGTDNVIATLGHSNRVCAVFLRRLLNWQLKRVLAVMQVPFPELTDLELSSYGGTPLTIPDSFLGGSAPHLLHFVLDSILIPGPGLSNLLLSATHLVRLWLVNIPSSGYISPEVITTLLCALSSLENFCLEFDFPQSLPDWDTRRPPQQKRRILPTLDYFRFQGHTGYLEDILTFIDTPQLDSLHVTLFNFDIQRLAQFINRTPKLRERHEAHVEFNTWNAGIMLGTLEIFTSTVEPDRRLLYVARVCDLSLHPFSTVEDLYIYHTDSPLDWTNDATENALWLRVLLPFTAVKKLYLSWQFTPGIAAALQELVGDRVTEVLPSLQNIFVEELARESFEKNIGRFVVDGLLSPDSSPVTLSSSLTGTKAPILSRHNTTPTQDDFGVQLAFPSFSVPPFLYRSPFDTSSHMYLHAYVLPVSSYTLSNVECSMLIGTCFASDENDPSCPSFGARVESVL